MNKLSVRQGILLGLLCGLLVSVSGLWWWNASSVQPAVIQRVSENGLDTEGQDAAQKSSVTPVGQSASSTEIVVHLAGAVVQPGLLRLAVGSRLGEAIIVAGGETEDADLDHVNLAVTLQDGQRYYIPRIGEAAAEGATDGQISSDGKVNINLADAETLASLPQIGEVRAQAIIAYREKNGNYQKAEDIMQVAGIGEGIYAAIADSITVQ
ncbi:MAG TPA: helix-hairpin-helix domain-containing protein [Bacillota bacterium]|nr:helix-hairpin-helix domain-containing protein [Bacillota bacterium]